MKIKLFLLLCAGLSVSSCGSRYFSARSTNPMIEDRVRAGPKTSEDNRSNVGVLTTRADRRTILLIGTDKICAEPPPDVAEAVSSQVGLKLGKSDSENAAFESRLQTALLQLAQRSQGLEMFRSSSFTLCNMYINNAFGDPAQDDAKKIYQGFMRKILDDSFMLIAHQIDKGSLPGTLATLQVAGIKDLTVFGSGGTDATISTGDRATESKPGASSKEQLRPAELIVPE